MPLPISPAARRGMQLCKCGHRASLHRYDCYECIGKDGMGRHQRPCTCTRFTPATNLTNHPTQSNK